jgi:hypothetical protein
MIHFKKIHIRVYTPCPVPLTLLEESLQFMYLDAVHQNLWLPRKSAISSNLSSLNWISILWIWGCWKRMILHLQAESVFCLIIFQQTSTNFAVIHLMLKSLVTMCWHVPSEMSAIFNSRLSVLIDDLMHFIHISINLDLKIFKMNFQNLEQNCSLLKYFCSSFVLYLSVHITSFL